MKLNHIEFLLMNNPVRTFIQEKYEVNILRKMSAIKNIENALEIGCGNGNGTKLIKKYFSAKNIIAIDLDKKMINIALKRNSDTSVTFKVMDAAKLDFPDNYFDAVFDLGVIHHISEWKNCIKEVHRVLKPGGEFILEELSLETFKKGPGKLWRALLDHPYDFMFTTGEFTDYLTLTGFKILNYKESNPFGVLKFFSLNAVRR